MIPIEKIAEIKSKVNIEDVISDFINLEKKGNNYVSVCPFHDDNSPSLSVSPVRQIFKCFVCGMGGDVFKFVSEFESVSYPESIKIVSKKTDVDIAEDSFYKKVVTPLSIELKEINKEASNFWNYNLTQNKKALEYLNKRGFDDKSIKHFSLGFSPSGKNILSKHLQNKGFKRDLIIKAGLSREKELELVDVFFNRIMFPIFNLENEIIGFSGRDVTGKSVAKYLNTSENEIFKKSEIIYNIKNASVSSRMTKNIYLVEGFFDVISLFNKDISDACASMGTAFGKKAIDSLKKYTKQVTIISDNDLAGMNSSMKSNELLKEEGIDVKFSIVPEPHKDIDEWINFKGSIFSKSNFEKSKKSFIEFYYSFLLKKYDVNVLSQRVEFFEMIKTQLSIEDNDVITSFLREKISKDLNIPISEVTEFTSFSNGIFSIESNHYDNVDELGISSNTKSTAKKTTPLKAIEALISMTLNNPEKITDIQSILEELSFSSSSAFLNSFQIKLKGLNYNVEEYLSYVHSTNNQELISTIEFCLNNQQIYSEKTIKEIVKILDDDHKHKSCLILEKDLILELKKDNFDIAEIEKIRDDMTNNNCIELLDGSNIVN